MKPNPENIEGIRFPTIRHATTTILSRNATFHAALCTTLITPYNIPERVIQKDSDILLGGQHKHSIPDTEAPRH